MADRPERATEGAPQVAFDGGCMGCLFLLMLPIALLGTIAAFDPGFAQILAASEARRNPVGLWRVGFLDMGALLVGLAAAWEAVRTGRRLLDPRAVWIEGDTIRFHPTVRRRALPLRALAKVTHESGDVKSILWLEEEGGKRIKVAMVDHDTARAFVAEAQQARAALTFG